jgi:hypothetical protein
MAPLCARNDKLQKKPMFKSGRILAANSVLAKNFEFV